MGVLDTDLQAISQEMGKLRAGKHLSDTTQFEIFKDRIQWLIAHRMAKGPGIKSLVQDAELLEPSTKGAIFEHYLDVVLANGLLADNVGRLSIDLKKFAAGDCVAGAGDKKYHNESTILSDKLLDRDGKLTAVEAKAVEGAFGTKQLNQLANYAQLIKDGVLISERNAYRSMADFHAADTGQPVPKPLADVMYIFSTRKAAEANREAISTALTLPDAGGHAAKAVGDFLPRYRPRKTRRSEVSEGYFNFAASSFEITSDRPSAVSTAT